MTNHERADQLLGRAERILSEIDHALDQSDWGLALRRAQEVLELTLKGLLTLMGVDYPKVHDPAKVFGKIARQRGLTISEEMLTEIQRASTELARKRAPVFYFEEDVEENEARRADQVATKVLGLARQWQVELQPPEDEDATTGQKG